MCIARQFGSGEGQYQLLGEAAHFQQKRGNKLGGGRTLTPREEERLQQLIKEHFPDELDIDSGLWTRSAVQALIVWECGIKMPRSHPWMRISNVGVIPHRNH